MTTEAVAYRLFFLSNYILTYWTETKLLLRIHLIQHILGIYKRLSLISLCSYSDTYHFEDLCVNKKIIYITENSGGTAWTGLSWLKADSSGGNIILDVWYQGKRKIS